MNSIIAEKAVKDEEVPQMGGNGFAAITDDDDDDDDVVCPSLKGEKQVSSQNTDEFVTVYGIQGLAGLGRQELFSLLWRSHKPSTAAWWGENFIGISRSGMRMLSFFTEISRQLIICYLINKSGSGMRMLSFLSGILIFLISYFISKNNNMFIPVAGSSFAAFQTSLMALIAADKRPKFAIFFGYTALLSMVVTLCFLGLSTVL